MPNVAPPPRTGLLDQARTWVGSTLQPPAAVGLWNALSGKVWSRLKVAVVVTPVVPITHSGRRSLPSQAWPALGPRAIVPFAYAI